MNWSVQYNGGQWTGRRTILSIHTLYWQLLTSCLMKWPVWLQCDHTTHYFLTFNWTHWDISCSTLCMESRSKQLWRWCIKVCCFYTGNRKCKLPFQEMVSPWSGSNVVSFNLRKTRQSLSLFQSEPKYFSWWPPAEFLGWHHGLPWAPLCLNTTNIFFFGLICIC